MRHSIDNTKNNSQKTGIATNTKFLKIKPNTIIQGHCLEVLKRLPNESIDCIVTSPPYWGLRDYGVDGQIGSEKTLNEFLGIMLQITKECHRVLKKTGTMWWNHGDSYNGTKVGNTNTKNPRAMTDSFKKERQKSMPEKSLTLQAHRLAIRMIDEQGWILRNQIIWHKPNAMPQSVKDRFTVDYEPIFFFSKSKRYWFEPQYEPTLTKDNTVRDRETTKLNNVPGRAKMGGLTTNNYDYKNKRAVWRVPTVAYTEAHFATFPPDLIAVPIRSGCPKQICKKCSLPRYPIIVPTEEYQKYLGKGFHDHKNDLEQGFGQQGRGFKKESISADYRISGYTDCGCNAGWSRGIVLDPFMGSGTTGEVALDSGRDYLGIELNNEYIKLAKKRIGIRLF